MSTIRNQREVQQPFVLDIPSGLQAPTLEQAQAQVKDLSERLPSLSTSANVLAGSLVLGNAGLSWGRYFKDFARNRILDDQVQKIREKGLTSFSRSDLPANFLDLSFAERAESLGTSTGLLSYMMDRGLTREQALDNIATNTEFGQLNLFERFAPNIVGGAGVVAGAAIGAPRAFTEGKRASEAVSKFQEKFFPKSDALKDRLPNEKFSGVNVGPLSISEARTTLENQAREIAYDGENRLKIDNAFITGIEPRVPLGSLEGNVVRHQNKLATIGATVPRRRKKRSAE